MTSTTTDPTLRTAAEPLASVAAAPTIVHLFLATARARGAAAALRRRGDEGWESTTWREYERAVAEVALGLAARYGEGDRIGLLSGNRPEWHIADMGVLAAGMVTTPVYPTSSSTQIVHVLRDSGARACFVENGEQLAKLLLRRNELPDVEHVILLEAVEGVEDGFVVSLAELRAEGRARLHRDRSSFEGLVDAVRPEDLATLVYTSGTTGPPKGAMITHANVVAVLRSLTSLIELRPTDRFLSFLPLSHITERSVSHFGQIACGGETWFARSLGTVPDDLRACRPTLFFAVPRVWEKFHDAIVEASTSGPLVLRAPVARYLDLSERRGDGLLPWGSATEHAAHLVLDRTIGTLLRRRLGLDRARVLSSGAAPIHADLLRWFHGIGLPVAEGYGQTEVSLCTSLNPPGDIRIGTVGPPIPGVEVRIAEDGEILVRGPGVCAGYWRAPEATAALIDPDGWLHTGDLGALDGDGYLLVSGRKKDLIINAYGKNISPSEIELALRHEPLISQAVVVGDGRPFLTALVALDPDAAVDWAAGAGRSLTVEELATDPGLHVAIDDAVTRVNAGRSHVEGIRRWRLLPHDLTVAGHELTPTLKVRREEVVREFADLVEEMYAEAASRTG
jgi:long-chain acyl-CoA synthetase